MEGNLEFYNGYCSVLANNANPNTLWELIKGTVRNTSIKYSSEKRITHNKLKMNFQIKYKNYKKT